MSKREARPASELIGELFRQRGLKRSLRRAEAVLLWPRVVGPDVARFSSARTLQDGVLIIDVSDSETAMHLSLQRRRFLARFHDTYGVHDVKEIRFQVGRVPSGATSAEDGDLAAGEQAAGDAAAAVDPQAVSAMARELEALGLPDDVGAAVLRAGRSLIGMRARQEAAGFSECPTCGALHDALRSPLTPRERTLREKGVEHPDLRDRELCEPCRRSAREPRVKAAARRLALSPGELDEELSESERAVAVRLASGYLDASLAELLPRAVSQPALRPQLELAARCRAALATGKRTDDLENADIWVLDERVARYLGGSWSEGARTDDQQ